MPNRETSPLIVLGLDAGDPVAIEQWAAEGRLPTIAALMQRGAWATLAGPELICEHGIWLSLFSGISRKRHGYYLFRQQIPGAYDLQLVNARHLNAAPLWQHLRGANIPLVAVDVPDTLPVPGLAGAQLTDWAVHSAELPPDSQPRELLSELAAQFGPPSPIDEKPNASDGDNLGLYRRLLARIERKGRVCRHLLKQHNPRLSAIVFAETHTGSHQFWRYRPGSRWHRPGHPLANAIRDIYQAVDRELGLILTDLPPNANIFIIGSTGMEDQYPSQGLLEDFLYKLGYKVRRPPGPPRTPMALLRRLLPESVRLTLSRGLPRAVRERLLAEQFRNSADWSRTTAVSVPGFYMGMIRVNLKGREPQGLVAEGSEYDSLLARLEDDLAQLVDPVSGRPAVRRTARATDLFGGGPPPILPDLFVDWAPSDYWRPALHHPKAAITQSRPEFFRDSDHTRIGFMAAAGPGLGARGRQPDASVLDLAPTFMTLLGQPVPDSMDGKPLPILAEP